MHLAIKSGIKAQFIIILLIFLLSLGLYTATLAPDLLWGGGDFALFQTLAYTGDITIERGPLSHPLWVILAHPFTKIPIRTVAWRANLASAFFASLALVFIYLSSFILTKSKPASLFATCALAVSHTYWTYAVMPKVYSLNALLLSLCIFLIMLWRGRGNNLYLYCFWFFYGLSFFNHLIMATVAAGFLTVFVLSTIKTKPKKVIWKIIIISLIFFLLGLIPYLYSISTIEKTGNVLGSIIGYINGVIYTLSHFEKLIMVIGWGIGLAIYQFPLVIIVGLIGIYYMWKNDQVVALSLITCMFGIILFLIAVIDPNTGMGYVYIWNLHFYLLAYVIFTIFIAAGFKFIFEYKKGQSIASKTVILAGIIIAPIIIYLLSPILVVNIWHNVPDIRPLPGRNNFVYVLSPWKQQEFGARQFGENILNALPENSILFADYSIWSVINYLQVVENNRPDVTLIELPGGDAQVNLILNFANRKNLFLADTYRYYDVDGISEYFRIIPEGLIYRMVYMLMP